MENKVSLLEHEIVVLKKQMRNLRQQVHMIEEWRDVISSPLWKRVWFVLCGWKWGSLGCWYGKHRWKG